MTPSARLAAAIELLDEVITASKSKGAAADTLAKRYFASRRYIGSKDRRAIREHVWHAIRACADTPPSARSVFVALADQDPDLAALFDGSGYGPSQLTPTELRATLASGAPATIVSLLYPFIDSEELLALTGRAPVDIRISRRSVDGGEIPAGREPLPPPLHGARYPPETAVDQHPAYLAGLFEIQDAGSQWIVEACGARPGMRVVDLCAGAGGKTLALADAMAGRGALLACDTDRRRLGQLLPRAARARLLGVETRLLNPRQEAAMLTDWREQADIVLVDAPCSGSGTWRRNPEARWRVDPESIRKYSMDQARLLRIGAELVAPGGALIYAVCALTMAEGTAVVGDFLEQYPAWQAEDLHVALLPPSIGRNVGAGIVLTPSHDQSDGFFFARLRAP